MRVSFRKSNAVVVATACGCLVAFTVGSEAMGQVGSTETVQARSGAAYEYTNESLAPESEELLNRKSGSAEKLKSGRSFDFKFPAGMKLIQGDDGVAAIKDGRLEFVAWSRNGSLRAVDDDSMKLVGADEAFVEMGTVLIDRVEVRPAPEGTIFAVFPTPAGRAAPTIVHENAGWADIKGMGVPDRRNLFEQYTCHPFSQAARVKESWNLDDWRPEVGQWATVQAGCNP